MRSLIVNGPPGVGKSYMVNELLKTHKATTHHVVSGHMTMLSLYMRLFDHRGPRQVLVLDDVDSVFSSIEGVNLLKAAMDTQPKRFISFESMSTKIHALQLPTRFEFQGGVILISNVGFGGTHGKLGAHLKALKDRSYCIQIADGSVKAAFVQVAYMVLKKGLLDSFCLTPKQVLELLGFMHEHLASLSTVSLRTMIKLAELYRLEPSNWRRSGLVALTEGGK